MFVTSSKVRGVDHDALAKEIREEYGWGVIIYSRAWLRLQLEEAQPDLAKKYLDVDVPADSAPAMRIGRLDPPGVQRFAEAWRSLEAGKYERAAVAINEVMEAHPEPDRKAYTALAWCQYQIRRYDEALSSINRALAMKDSSQGRAIRACILVEKGIAMRDRASLVEGKKIFERLVTDEIAPVWCNLFNLGNAQGALGDHHAAIASYQGVLKERPEQVETLKNLGSEYHRVGEHAREIECFDRALEIEPLKWEALVSKAVSLIVDFSRPADAAKLLEQALTFHPERAVTWPHVWYWLADARRRSGNDAAALTTLDQGLAHQPGHRAMWRLKSDLLQAMATADPEEASRAEGFWRARLDSAPSDYGTRERLMRLQLRQENERVVWSGLEDHWCTDVTYIPLQRGFLYLVAVMDWASRKVLAWRLSNTLEVSFCVAALRETLEGYDRSSTSASTCPSSPLALRPGPASAGGWTSTTGAGPTRRSTVGRQKRRTLATKLTGAWGSAPPPVSQTQLES